MSAKYVLVPLGSLSWYPEMWVFLWACVGLKACVGPKLFSWMALAYIKTLC